MGFIYSFWIRIFPPEALHILTGDVNYDQIVNITDIITIINWILSDYILV